MQLEKSGAAAPSIPKPRQIQIRDGGWPAPGVSKFKRTLVEFGTILDAKVVIDTSDLPVRITENLGGRGQGLKATRCILEDEVICRYSGKYIPNDMPTPASANPEHEFTAPNGRYFRGDQKEDLGWLVNDAIDPKIISELQKCLTIRDCLKWEAKYNHWAQQESWMSSWSGSQPLPHNCLLAEIYGPGKGLWVVAIHDIQEGEDLLTLYGPDYWIGITSLREDTHYKTKIAMVGYALRKMAFPKFGIAHGIHCITFPAADEDGEIGIGALHLAGADESGTIAILKSKAKLQGIAATWLKKLGFPLEMYASKGVSAHDAWMDACIDVGTTDVPTAGEGSREIWTDLSDAAPHKIL